MRRTRTVVALAILALLIVLPLGCGPKKTAKLTPGTGVDGLSPVPADMVSDVYCVDTAYGRDCAEVSSGLNHCMDLMRREASRNLAEILEKEIVGKYRDTAEIEPTSEDRQYFTDFKTGIIGRLSMRKHESPLFTLPDGRNYSLRTCLVREEVDYHLWSQMVEKSTIDDRTNVSEAFGTLLEERYRDHGPNEKKVEEVEKRIAVHFDQMWKMGVAEVTRK